ncbi:MAG: hypothetical protein KAX39_07950, partial [candidate division Zixibacteria bacterium]|nr:hypothetical protein [candidate division Zixibacteria bacterium]
MKKNFLTLTVFAFSIFVFSTFSWAQCPEDPNDRGECDTLNVICLDCEIDTTVPGPYFVRFPLLVTHDQTVADDSIAGFAIPFTWTHTNPSKYCSLGIWWNTTSTLWVYPDFARSIFRHIVEGTDTLYHNRLADLAADFSGRDWDTRILSLSTDPPFMGMALVPTGTADQRWWDGDRVLLATLTFRIEDTMHVCMDTTLWPPSSRITFSRSDGQTYIPRDNLPQCFKVGPPAGPCEDPEHFVFTDSTGDSYSIVIDSALLDDLELEECDEIGVFDDTGGGKGLLCVGASVYHPADLPIPLIAWKDDPLTPQKDGYIAGDTMYFRVWSKNQDREEEACAYYSVGDGHFESGFFSQLWLEAPCGPPPPESVTITSPNGGEDWCEGSAQSITWTSVNIDTVEIEYSTDGGSTWIAVVDKTPAGPGSYSWTVP